MDLTHTVIHSIFDALAWAAAAVTTRALSRFARIDFPVAQRQHAAYYAAFVAGAAIGAYLFGTLNLIACAMPGIGRSIEGAIFGAVAGVEAYKRSADITVRTGARFAAPLAVGVAIGRIGCYYSGIDDFTYGTPTDLPWGHDFGDGIPRHPVPLYESAAMALFLAAYLIAAIRENRYVIENGLYLAILWYAVQRFAWEFVKPYAAVLGTLTIFQILSILLSIYAVSMLLTAKATSDERAVHA